MQGLPQIVPADQFHIDGITENCFASSCFHAPAQPDVKAAGSIVSDKNAEGSRAIALPEQLLKGTSHQSASNASRGMRRITVQIVDIGRRSTPHRNEAQKVVVIFPPGNMHNVTGLNTVISPGICQIILHPFSQVAGWQMTAISIAPACCMQLRYIREICPNSRLNGDWKHREGRFVGMDVINSFRKCSSPLGRTCGGGLFSFGIGTAPFNLFAGLTCLG